MAKDHKVRVAFVDVGGQGTVLVENLRSETETPKKTMYS
jgi:hypothetical protein